MRNEEMKVNTCTIEILPEISPLLTFTMLVKRAVDSIGPPVEFGKLPGKIVRIEYHPGPAAGQLRVRFYPSDEFLDFAAVIFARNLNFEAADGSRSLQTSKRQRL